MERKTLSSFIKPLNYYYDVKTDRNVPMDPARDETPRPAAVALLPEYGNLPEHMPTGTRIIIGKHNLELVRAGRDSDDTPQYRLRHNLTLTGNAVFSVDDLNIMGAKIVLDKV